MECSSLIKQHLERGREISVLRCAGRGTRDIICWRGRAGGGASFLDLRLSAFDALRGLLTGDATETGFKANPQAIYFIPSDVVEHMAPAALEELTIWTIPRHCGYIW